MKEFFEERKWIIVAIVVITVTIVLISISCKKVKFEVDEFSISEHTTDYSNIDNYTSYTGEGTIKTKDKKGVYLVVVRQELVSGGSDDSEQEEIFSCIVANGEGKFATYDSGTEGEIKKPKYRFEIIGYQKMK